MILVNIDREQDGVRRIDEALAMAERLDARHLVPMGLIYRGRARLQLGEEAGLAELLRGLELARVLGNHEYVLWGYHNLVALLWRLGRYAEIPRYLEEGAAYGRDHDFPTHERGREAYRYRLLGLQGDWDAAEQGLREVLGDPEDPGVLDRHALPALARLAVRRGRDDAETTLAAARRNAERADSLLALVPTAAAELEHAWLTGRSEIAQLAADVLPRTEPVGRERDRGELLRFLRRLGKPVEAFPGCPEEYAAGLRGDWRAAASAWERIGDPYERALELAESGLVAPNARGVGGIRRPRRPARGSQDPPAAAGVGGDSSAARPHASDAQQPDGPHRSPGRDPSPAGLGTDERGDRDETRRVRAHRRPPRLRRAAETRRGLAPRGRTTRGPTRSHRVTTAEQLRAGNWERGL